MSKCTPVQLRLLLLLLLLLEEEEEEALFGEAGRATLSCEARANGCK